MIAYFANQVKYQRLAYLENDLIESMWFKICPDNEQLFLLCFIYRPRSSNAVWYEHFEGEIMNTLVES